MSGIEYVGLFLVFLAWPAVGLFLWAMFKSIFANDAGRRAAIYAKHGYSTNSREQVRAEWGRFFAGVYEEGFDNKMASMGEKPRYWN